MRELLYNDPEGGSTYEQKPKRESCTDIQGKGRLGSIIGRPDDSRAGSALSGSSEPEHRMEEAAVGECGRDFQP